MGDMPRVVCANRGKVVCISCAIVNFFTSSYAQMVADKLQGYLAPLGPKITSYGCQIVVATSCGRNYHRW